ncbi:hypothetical protein EMCRGX_G018549 [Ephydatia muelleri]
MTGVRERGNHVRNGKGQEAATAPSIGIGHIGRRRSPPGEEESHPQSQAGASGEDKGQADGDWHSGFGSERPISAAPHMDEKYNNWEEVLSLTKPENWAAAAMFQATKIFASNLSTSMAQNFYNLVLLPRIRDNIAEYKRLNFHLYMVLKKTLFKPAAFFKGILLPLCRSGSCSLREALIIASALAKTSVPMLHSGTAVLKIAEMEYSGANSIFLR